MESVPLGVNYLPVVCVSVKVGDCVFLTLIVSWSFFPLYGISVTLMRARSSENSVVDIFLIESAFQHHTLAR